MNYTKYQDNPVLEDKSTPTTFDIFKPYLYFVLLVAYLGIGVFWLKNYMAVRKTEELTASVKSQTEKIIWGKDALLFVSNDGADTLYITNEDSYLIADSLCIDHIETKTDWR